MLENCKDSVSCHNINATVHFVNLRQAHNMFMACFELYSP